MESKVVGLLCGLHSTCRSDPATRNIYTALAIILHNRIGDAIFGTLLDSNSDLQAHADLLYMATRPCMNAGQRNKAITALARYCPERLISLLNQHQLSPEEQASALLSLQGVSKVSNMRELRTPSLVRGMLPLVRRVTGAWLVWIFHWYWPTIAAVLVTGLLYVLPLIYYDKIPQSLKDRLQILSSIHELAIGGVIALLLLIIQKIREFRSQRSS